MGSRFCNNEPGLSLRSRLYQVAKEGGHRTICGISTMYGDESISFLWKSRGTIICGRVLSQRTRKQEDFTGSFGQGPRFNWTNNFEATVSWGGGGREIQRQG